MFFLRYPILELAIRHSQPTFIILFRRHTYFAKLDILRIIGRLELLWHSPVVARVLVGNDNYRTFQTNALQRFVRQLSRYRNIKFAEK